MALLLETKLNSSRRNPLCARQQFFCELHFIYTDFGLDAATRVDGEFAAVECSSRM